MTRFTRSEMDIIAARHPGVVDLPLSRRLRGPIMAGVLIAYLAFCSWFFAIGHIMATANWSIAGAYLADWVSYEIRPDIRIGKDGLMRVVYPNNDPIGPNPDPDWLKADFETVNVAAAAAPAAVTTQSAAPAQATTSIFMPAPANAQTSQAADAAAPAATEKVTRQARVEFSSDSSIDVTPSRVIVTRGSESFTVPLDGSSTIRLTSPLPAWAKQRAEGEKVVISFGAPGWAEVETDRVRIRKRFFGWENFIFDTDSAFFGMSASQVATAVWSGPELKPGTSNWDLAWNDFLYNPSWQHLDVWIKLLQTIVMAFVGTVLATAVSFPLSFMAARNITRNGLINQATKRLFDFLRSVDMLIWALFFTRAFGPGPLSGMSAIFFTDTGTLGKLYAEALENIDTKQPEGVRSVGASPVTVNRFGVLPQVLPVFMSQALYFWESNTRSATIIGAVGAGGIGLKLWEAMRTNSDWENVAYMVILILIVVFAFDSLSSRLRARLVGGPS